MKIKTTLAAIALFLTPAVATAMECGGGKHAATDTASIECGDGMIADDATNTCVPTTG